MVAGTSSPVSGLVCRTFFARFQYGAMLSFSSNGSATAARTDRTLAMTASATSPRKALTSLTMADRYRRAMARLKSTPSVIDISSQALSRSASTRSNVRLCRLRPSSSIVKTSSSTFAACRTGPDAAPNGPKVSSFSTKPCRPSDADSPVIGSLPMTVLTTEYPGIDWMSLMSQSGMTVPSASRATSAR